MTRKAGARRAKRDERPSRKRSATPASSAKPRKPKRSAEPAAWPRSEAPERSGKPTARSRSEAPERSPKPAARARSAEADRPAARARRAGSRPATRRVTLTPEWATAIFEGSRDAIFISDPEARFVAVNEAACRLTGYGRDELLRMRIPDLHEDLDLDAYRTFHDRILGGEEVLSRAPLLRKDGSKVETEFSNRVVTVSGATYMHTTARDVSERVAAEAARDADRRRFQVLSDIAPFAMVLVEPDGRVSYVNAAFVRMFGYALEEVPTQEAWRERAYPDPEYRRRVRETWARDHTPEASGIPEVRIFEVRCKDGTVKNVRLVWAPLPTGQSLLACEDVSAIDRAYRALRESEARYRMLVENAVLAVFESGADGTVVAVNDAFAKMFGYASPDEFKSCVRNSSEVFADPGRRSAIIRSNILSEGVARVENLYRRKDGTTFTGMLHARGVRDAAGNLVRIEGFIEDVTDRRRAEEQVRTREEHYRYALDLLADPVFVKDRQHRWRILNEAYCRFMGYPREQLIGKSDFDFFPRAEAEVFWAKDDEVFASGRENVNEEKFTSADGTQHTISTKKSVFLDSQTGEPILVGIIRDVTEARRIAEELARYREQLEDVVRERTRELAQTNERLLREADERTRAEQLRAAVYEISEATQQAGTLDELYAAVHAVVGRFMDTSSFFIALYDPDLDLLTFPYYVSAAIGRPEPFAPGKGLTSHVLRSGQALLGTPEVLEEFRRRGDVHTVGTPSVSWLGVPLTVGDRVIGVLAVQTFTPGARYGERERDVLLFVSRQVGLAIERKRAEEALRFSEEKFRTTLAGFSEGLVLVDEAGRVIEWNAALERIFGIARESALGRPLWDVEWEVYLPERKTPEMREYLKDSVLRTLRDGVLPSVPSETAMRAVDGTIRIVQQAVFVIRTGRGNRVGIIFSDVTERKKAEEALRASEERYRMVFQRAPVGVVHYDTSLRITDCNDRFASILRAPRERLVGLDMNTIHDKRLLPAIRAAVQGGFGEYVGAYRGTISGADLAGSLRTAPLRGRSGAVTGAVGIVEDHTEQMRLEEQLRHSQRMEAVGHLAGGVAHDFNNLMQAMLSQAHLLRAADGDAAKVAELAYELEEQVGRGAALTRQLLLFSRRETTRPEPLDLNDVVRDTARLLRRLVRENIAVAIELDAAPLPVMADRGQLQQVLMNLTVNASDAMPGGGRLTITTDASDPHWASLRVADTGHGIPDEIRDRIFEPFFTTKSAGGGTGLGLSVVHGIVSGHGGRVEVTSALGEGSSFEVVLPRADAGESFGVEQAPQDAADVSRGRGERILVVEDEDGAREGLREILASLDYQVAAVASAEEALGLSERRPFDLLLTDLLLPGIGGAQLATTLRRRQPDLEVIFMSGYAQSDALRLDVSAGVVRFLQKPFDMATLAREVRGALDQTRGA